MSFKDFVDTFIVILLIIFVLLGLQLNHLLSILYNKIKEFRK